MHDEAKDTERDRLRKLLEADTDSASDVEVLLSILQRLRTTPTHRPTLTQTHELITVLEAELMPVPSPRRALSPLWAWALLRTQVRVVRGGLWWASALVMLLGVLVTVLSMTAAKRDVIDLPLTLAAPLIAAMGLALLFDEDTLTTQELEAALPTPVMLVTLARLLIVFGFNLLLALASSMVLTVIDPALPLGELIVAWLAPMTFLSALSFFFSVLTGDGVMGAISGLVLWGALVAMRVFYTSTPATWLTTLPDVYSAEGRWVLLLLALPIFAAALWLTDARPAFLTRRNS